MLAAVVHAPLAAILILFDVSQTPATILPAILASVVAVGAARLLFPESIYSLSLRRRGVRVGTAAAPLFFLLGGRLYEPPGMPWPAE